MSLCATCKGRGQCGRPVCPILSRHYEVQALPAIGCSLMGDSPPELFVGRHGYPFVRAGPMLPARGNAFDLSPASLEGHDVSSIISIRSSMVRSEMRLKVSEAQSPGRLLSAAFEVAMSKRPVCTQLSFKRPPRGTLSFDGIMAPSGPSAPLLDISIVSNPAVPRKVDQIVNDRGVMAFQAARELYRSNIDLDHISRLLSMGMLGKKRRLVPTRWAITASDDMIGRELAARVKDMPVLEAYELYSGTVLANHFEILLFPESFRFELIEIWLAHSVWSGDETWIGADREDSRGRSGYSTLSGGYYAARLPLLEAMERRGRQAGALVIREVGEDYWAPLGVWVVRQAARRAMASPPMRFWQAEEALSCLNSRIRTPFSRWRQHSERLKKPRQTSLDSFI